MRPAKVNLVEFLIILCQKWGQIRLTSYLLFAIIVVVYKIKKLGSEYYGKIFA